MVESSIVTYRYEIVTASRGGPVSVEFDFETVWEYRKQKKNNVGFDPKRLHWIHVHPPGVGTDPSSTDEDCAKGLSLAFGKEFGMFTIVEFFDNDLNSLEGKCSNYRYNGSKLELQTFGYPENHIDHRSLTILKALAYTR